MRCKSIFDLLGKGDLAETMCVTAQWNWSFQVISVAMLAAFQNWIRMWRAQLTSPTKPPPTKKYSSNSASANVLNKHKTSFIATFKTVRRLQRGHIQAENYVNHSAGRFSEQNATRPETEWNSISVCKSRPRQGSHPGELSDRDSRRFPWRNFCSPLRNTSRTSSTRRRDYSASMDFSGRIAPFGARDAFAVGAMCKSIRFNVAAAVFKCHSELRIKFR